MDRRILYLAIVVFCISLLCLEFLYIPYLNSEIELKFTFDSVYYLKRSSSLISDNNIDPVAILEMAVTNKLGPLLLGFIARNNHHTIWLINLALYIGSMNSIVRRLNLSPISFNLFVLCNLISWISLVSLNKEIFIILTIALLLKYLEKLRLQDLFMCLMAAIMVRWQMVLFVVIIMFLYSRLMPFKRKRKLHLILFLVFVSVSLPLYTESVLESIEFWRAQSMKRVGVGSGLYLVWINMDQAGLYVLSFVFKLIHLTILNLVSFISYPKINLSYFHNFAEVLQSFSFVLLYIKILMKRNYFVSNNIMYISAFYFMIFVTVQIFTPRYLYGGYIFMSILASQHKGSNQAFRVKN